MADKNSVYEAAYKGDYEAVRNQVEQNPKLITTPDSNNRLIIHWGALSGNVKLITFLLDSGSPVDPEDDTSTTPLILAASAGRHEVVKLLISRGAKVNHKTTQGHSALQYACSKGWTEVAALLLQNKADVNIVDIRGATPLHRASSKGNLIIVKLLLGDNSIKIDARDYYLNSPLHLACEEDRQEEAKLLVQHGANPKLLNKEGQTPLDLCTRSLARIILNLGEQ